MASELRNVEKGEMNYVSVADILDSWIVRRNHCYCRWNLGTLVLFGGRNPVNRVTPVIGQRIPVFPVLGYNAAPGIAL